MNLGDGNIHSLTVDEVYLLGIAITDIYQQPDSVTFGGELFHEVFYSAAVSIDDDDMLNTIEDYLNGHEELVAAVSIELPLKNSRDINILSVGYNEALNLKLPLKY